VIALGFDPVDAFNLLIGRLDRIAVALEKIAKQLEATKEAKT
jgi:hypothetical protein